jgi:alginate O-acetyltransferase complex protein AlgI
MLFNSFTYLIFLPIIVALYWLLPAVCRRGLLLVASYVFYMNWIPAYGLLILLLTVVNYFLGLAIFAHQKRRKLVLTLGLIFNLGCLCFYKYANFLIDSLFQSATWLHTKLGLPLPVPVTEPVVNIILPLGISFFTFEFIHYITDVYRGSQPVKNFWNFALFAAFFPSQIAGPIKRFQDFMKQLLEEPVFRPSTFQAGLYLIFLGLFKKIVLGDNLGQVVNIGFNHLDKLGTLDAWIAVVGFQLQIFFDFSGYTDIGRGSALAFGYKVPKNFNWPFLASNLTEFWHRWHMSLSTWLRDYLFIPLGGSRGGAWKTRRNVMLTMILGGLWHGAAWHYVIWGAFHGGILVLTKEWQDFVSKIGWLARLRPHPIWHCAGVLVTWFLLFMAGILFRSDTMPHALAMAQKLFVPASSGQVVPALLESTLPVTLSAYALFLICSVCWERSDCSQPDAKLASQQPSRTGWRSYAEGVAQWWQNSFAAQAVTYASVALIVLGFAPGKMEPFIYFQF